MMEFDGAGDVARSVRAACEDTPNWRGPAAWAGEAVRELLEPGERICSALPGFVTPAEGVWYACLAVATTRRVVRVDDHDGFVLSVPYTRVRSAAVEEFGDGSPVRVLIITAEGRGHTVRTPDRTRAEAFVEIVKGRLAGDAPDSPTF